MGGFVPGQAPKNLAAPGTLPASACSLIAADRLGMLRHFPAVAWWTHSLSPVALWGEIHASQIQKDFGS